MYRLEEIWVTLKPQTNVFINKNTAGGIIVKAVIQHVSPGAFPGFGRGGGGQEIFFQIWEFACREATCCAWRSHAHC